MIYKGQKQELFEDESTTREIVFIIFNIYSEFRRKTRNPEKAPIEHSLYAPILKEHGLDLTREEFEELTAYAFESYGAESTDQILYEYDTGKLKEVKYKP